MQQSTCGELKRQIEESYNDLFAPNVRKHNERAVARCLDLYSKLIGERKLDFLPVSEFDTESRAIRQRALAEFDAQTEGRGGECEIEYRANLETQIKDLNKNMFDRKVQMNCINAVKCSLERYKQDLRDRTTKPLSAYEFMKAHQSIRGSILKAFDG